jgi:thioredoxin-related protein
MKPILLLFFALALPPSVPEWSNDFAGSLAKAEQEGKVVLLSFSGSDWCVPCMRMEKEIFGSAEFRGFAGEHLILAKADFPRLKRNRLSPAVTAQNDSLASVYNPEGSFPCTVLLTSAGKILKLWKGYPNLSPAEFVHELSTYTDVH